jgi:hypothetical protein
MRKIESSVLPFRDRTKGRDSSPVTRRGLRGGSSAKAGDAFVVLMKQGEKKIANKCFASQSELHAPHIGR